MRNFLMLIALAVGLACVPAHAQTAKPDGSDPMPTCRCTSTNNCNGRCGHLTESTQIINDRELVPVKHEFVTEPVAFTEIHPNYTIADGGPIPICPPRCIPNGGPNCGKCGAHVLDVNYVSDVFSL